MGSPKLGLLTHSLSCRIQASTQPFGSYCIALLTIETFRIDISGFLFNFVVMVSNGYVANEATAVLSHHPRRHPRQHAAAGQCHYVLSQQNVLSQPFC